MRLAIDAEIVEINYEKVLIPMDLKAHPMTLKMNQLAAEIAEMLMQETTEEEILGRLQEMHTDRTDEELRRSIDKVLGKLSSAGLLNAGA